MKTVLVCAVFFVICSCSKATSSPKVQDVTRTYNSEKDVTTFETRRIRIPHAKYEITLQAVIEYKGSERPDKLDPPEIMVFQTPTGKDPGEFVKVAIIVDGINVYAADTTAPTSVEDNQRVFFTGPSASQFLKIVTGKKVHMRFGELEFDFPDEGISLLNKLSFESSK